jgi:hypothetical protein
MVDFGLMSKILGDISNVLTVDAIKGGDALVWKLLADVLCWRSGCRARGNWGLSPYWGFKLQLNLPRVHNSLWTGKVTMEIMAKEDA